MSSSEGTQCMRVHFFRLVNQPRNGNFRTEQGLLRLLRTQPHRKYQSHVHNSLLRTHHFVLVPKLPLRAHRHKVKLQHSF